MAENELSVVNASSATKLTRSFDLNNAGIHLQGALVAEAPEVPVSGGTVRYSVTPSASVPLVPPAAAYRYARVRAYNSTASATARLYYRQDGTAPLNSGSNATGFLLHGNAMIVRLANAANWRAIAESGMTGTYELYVEWLTIPSS